MCGSASDLCIQLYYLRIPYFDQHPTQFFSLSLFIIVFIVIHVTYIFTIYPGEFSQMPSNLFLYSCVFCLYIIFVYIPKNKKIKIIIQCRDIFTLPFQPF